MNNIEKSPDRIRILEKIEEYEKKGWFDRDVEDDPHGKELKITEVDYLNKKIFNRIATKFSNTVARIFMNNLIKKHELIIKDIIGLENYTKLDTGAIITCNHFNALDSFAMHIAYDYSGHKKRKLYKIIKEENYTSFPGFYGLLMRHCNTLPLSSNKETMKHFIHATDTILKRGDFVLIYPEQSMWWNYRKPKPLKVGAFKFATKSKVPILPCFITMNDSEIIGKDGFPIQEYTINISKPIYPDYEKSVKENADYLMKENAEIWKNIYEKSYGISLEYTKAETY